MSSYKTLPTPGDTAWFTHDRFGMFIHFGLYAMPARHDGSKITKKSRKITMISILSILTRICTIRRNGQDRQKPQA